MNEKTIIDFLGLQNKWWENKKYFPFKRTYSFKRSDYYHLVDYKLEGEEALVITGPRGVGKSTVLLEIIRELLGFSKGIAGEVDIKTLKLPENKDSIEKRRILYVSFDEISLQKLKLLDILKIYVKYILRQDISQLKDKIYVFFDEIQNIDEWGAQIKTIQDLKYPIKIIISGSSSVNMLNESSKAARRVELYSMHPLKFSDYLLYKINNKDFEKVLSDLKNFRKENIKYFIENNAQGIYDSFLQYYTDLKEWQTKIELYFEEYLIKGGYPDLLEEENYITCTSKLRDTFLLGLHKDLVLSKGIGDPKGMRSLVEYIASISSCETTYTSLMENSKTATNTAILEKYIYHLEKAYLIKISNRFSGIQTRRKTKFKIYLTDIAVRNMLQGMMNELLLNNQKEYGFALETLVYDHLVRLYYKLRPDMPLLYWKDERTKKEVDIILKLNNHYIPIEVKKSDSPSLSDVSGLRTFCREYKTPGLVVCGKKLELEENIIFLPHWLFILIC